MAMTVPARDTEQQTCTCNPLHIEVGGFDSDCPVHA